MISNPVDPEHVVRTERGTVLTDPPLAQFLFSDTRMAPVWLVIRLLLGRLRRRTDRCIGVDIAHENEHVH